MPHQNPDIFFQAREASNKFYDLVPDIVEEYMQEITKLTGREYHPFTYYGDKNAENIIMAMGSVTETIKDVIDYLNSKVPPKDVLFFLHISSPISCSIILKFLRISPILRFE